MKQKLNCILLIDDDDATNFLNNVIIEEANCTARIITRVTAIDGLNYIIENEASETNIDVHHYPDLIFLDINMPSMSGWEFLDEYREIKNNNLTSPVIIMLSSSADPYDKLKAFNTPEVAAIYSKPMTAEIIRTVISEYFPQCI